MPPRVGSRFTFTSASTDARDSRGPEALFMLERVPYGYRALADNIVHVVQAGDTLWHLAATYYRGSPRAAGFWWVIADFQPDPIVDPTIELTPGATLIIPSQRTLIEYILSERRRNEAQA